tara:strand:- start:678 stop:1577 length:900 start_codon:yes stop_codon:yes gene_type:complete
MSKIFISTSKKIFEYDLPSKQIKTIFEIKPIFLSFIRKNYKTLFGIDYIESKNELIFICRDRLKTKKLSKPSTDAVIYSYCLDTRDVTKLAVIKNIHDAHQMKYHKGYIFMTDCGLNRIIFYNLKSSGYKYLNIGKIRSDINHLNAVMIYGDRLLIGLNNNGRKCSEIYEYNLDSVLKSNDVNIYLEPDIIHTLHDIQHTHDIHILKSNLVFCDSHEGKVYMLKDLRCIYKIDGWARGLCSNSDELYVGSSVRSMRSERYTSNLDAKIYKIDLSDSLINLEVVLPNCGQVNDMVLVKRK